MYDPATARFLQEDTYTGDPNDPLSLNLYTYCHNEPIMYWDPSGHTDVYLNDLVSAYNGSASWNNKNKVVTFKVNGQTYKVDTKKDKSFKNVNGQIVVDTHAFDKKVTKGNIVYQTTFEASSDRIIGTKLETVQGGFNQTQNIVTNNYVIKNFAKPKNQVEAVTHKNSLNSYYKDGNLLPNANQGDGIIDTLLSLSGAVSFAGNAVSAIAINVNDWSGMSKSGKVVNIIKDIALPSTTEVSEAERLVNRAVEIGGSGARLQSGKYVSISKVKAISTVSKVGKVVGVVGTIITPVVEASNSYNMIKDDLEWIKENDPNNYAAIALAYTSGGFDASSLGFVRSFANTIPALAQLYPGEDPQWTEGWIDGVNQFNVKNASNFVVDKWRKLTD